MKSYRQLKTVERGQLVPPKMGTLKGYPISSSQQYKTHI